MATQRKCSVCRQPGHTKRTCPRNSTLVTERRRVDAAPPQREVFNATDCPICLEPLGAISTVTTPCGHQFCLNCFGTHTRTKTNCPNCRTEIPGVTPAPAPHLQLPSTAGGSFPIFVQNLSTEAFNIFWLPPPDLSGAVRHPIQLHSNIRPGTTRRVTVGRRGDRFRLVHTGIRLAEFQTSQRSSDNFVYTGTEVIELV